MRTVVITPMPPPQREADRVGGHRREIVFLRALAALSGTVEIIHLVPERVMGLAANPAELDRSQSAFWGIDVKASLAPMVSRPKTAWSLYGQGVFDAAGQPELFPYSGAAAAEVVGRVLDSTPDLVFVDRLSGLVPVLRSRRRPRRLVFDFMDVDHVVRGRALFLGPFRAGKLGMAMQIPSLVLAERKAVALSSASIVCSETERTNLHRLGFEHRIEVIPNALTPPSAVPPVAADRTVLFLGTYHYGPNRMAAERLSCRIWPLVRSMVQDARLVIAGPESDTLPSRHVDQPGVDYLGYAQDLDALYASARVFCAPIVTGSGTRLKIIEAASYGRPIVATAVAAEGLVFRDGYDILLRKTDEDVAQACVTLLNDDGMCRRLGDAARRTMLDNYDAKVVEARSRALFDRVLAG